MARVAKKVSSGSVEPTRPALTPEAREKQLISLAVDCAEKQMMEGTASSQVIVHYLKLATAKERLERERLEEENRLLKAKTEALQSAKRNEELYRNVLVAMRKYSGAGQGDEDEDYSDLY